ncbi:MAG: hypothetical protein JRI68_16315 [Deltaproteobacteria bacterium]|nr:hypothetical protein [Deltaproteobacteria bacterium]
MNKLTAILCALCLTAFGCGADDGADDLDDPGAQAASCEGELDLSGQWAGTWTSLTADGTWQVDWVQDEAGNLDGTIVVTGTVCGSGGTVSGAVNGCQVSFGLVDTSACEVSYSGSVDGDWMSGSLEASGFGLKDNGNWEGERQ